MNADITEIKNGTHAHYCAFCASQGVETVWAHGNEKAGNLAEHRCPRCGRVEWVKSKIPSGKLPQAQAIHAQVIEVVTVQDTLALLYAFGFAMIAIVILVKYKPQIIEAVKAIFAKKA
jgi:DNA-directed RNA polymerase subunit RPC12/RpoP